MARAAGARRSPRDAGKSPRRTDVVTVRGAGRAPEARPPAERPAAEDAAEPKCAREVGRTDGAGRDEAGRIGADAGRRDGEALRETPPRALPREVEPRGTETLRLLDLLATATVLVAPLACGKRANLASSLASGRVSGRRAALAGRTSGW